MQITFSPMRSLPGQDGQLDSLVVEGDTITINGDTIDMTAIPEGAILPAQAVAHDFITGPVSRSGGELSLTLVLPIRADASRAVTSPGKITVISGHVPLPGRKGDMA